jgi:hypothetical protein
MYVRLYIYVCVCKPMRDVTPQVFDLHFMHYHGITCTTSQISNETCATSQWNMCNMTMKHVQHTMKHVQHQMKHDNETCATSQISNETCATSQRNMCNITMKHVKHEPWLSWLCTFWLANTFKLLVEQFELGSVFMFSPNSNLITFDYKLTLGLILFDYFKSAI